MPRAGRRRSAVWACFVDNYESGRRRVLCRFCQHDIVANPIRMVRHIVKHCPNADEQHKKICREYQTLTVPARRRVTPPPTEDIEEADIPPHSQAIPLALVPPSVVDFPAVMSVEEAQSCHSPTTQSRLILDNDSILITNAVEDKREQRVHDQFVLAALTSGAPLSMFDNSHLHEAFRLLDIPPPNLAEVLSRLLDRVSANTRDVARAATALTVQVTSLVVESSSMSPKWYIADQDHRQVPLVNEEGLNTSIPLAQQVQMQLEHLDRRPHCLVHLCTDLSVPRHSSPNLANNASGVPNLQLSSRCMMQASLSLLVALLEATPSVLQAIEVAAAVCSRLLASESLLSELRRGGEFDESALHLDRKSLWSIFRMVDRVVRLRPALIQAHNGASGPIDPIVDDERFWTKLIAARELIRPFGFLMILSEEGRLTSSIVIASWLLALSSVKRSSCIPEREKSAISQHVMEHINRYGDPLALICFMLDPRFRGVGLAALGKRKVRAHVVELASRLDHQVNQSALLEQLIKFLGDERPFDDEESWQMMSSLPRLFWIEYMSEAHELASVALATLSFRPFINSLQYTFEALHDIGKRHTNAEAFGIASDLSQPHMRFLVRYLDSSKRHNDRHLKQNLDEAFKILLSTVDDTSWMSLLEASDVAETATIHTMVSTEFRELWDDLVRAVTTHIRQKGEGSDGCADESWFDVSRHVAQELDECLQRSVFGEIATTSNQGQRPGNTEESATDAFHGVAETVL